MQISNQLEAIMVDLQALIKSQEKAA